MEGQETTNTEQGTTQEQEFVPIHEATDDDIESFLKSSQATSQAPDAQTQEPTKSEAQQVTVEEETEAPQEKGDEAPDQQVQSLQAENERLKKQLQQTELFAKRRSTEIGELRKQLRAANEKLSSGLEDEFVNNPAQATKKMLAIEKNEQHLQQLDAEENAINSEVEAQQLFYQHVPQEHVNIEAMAETLSRDGLDSRFIEQFKANPFRVAHPETLIHLQRRAQLEQALKEIVTYTRALQHENKKLKTKPDQVLKNVSKALKESPKMTAAVASNSQTEDFSTFDPTTASDEALEQFLKRKKL